MDAPPRITLDSQLVSFWRREAARLDALSEQARFGWQKRRLARKARDARRRVERSLAREAQRGSHAGGEEMSQG